jgi:hypothetical protein
VVAAVEKLPARVYSLGVDTGFPTSDAQTDFSRARRREQISRLARRMRRERDDVNVILPFDEVVQALGRRGERRLGLETIPLDSIVGTVDRSREFDRRFRPTSRRVRYRWQRIAEAMRRGAPMPPIDVYRVGDMHFVRDGHHRVSVARQLRLDVIEAHVTEILTEVRPDRETRLGDLAVKSHKRLFLERVPLPADARARLRLSDEWRYGDLAETVEAWGARAMHGRGEFMNREEVAARWYEDEYVPAIELLREADLLGRGTEADAYMRISALRYMLLRTHDWDDATLERLRQELDRGPPSDDSMVHRLLRDL